MFEENKDSQDASAPETPPIAPAAPAAPAAPPAPTAPEAPASSAAAGGPAAPPTAAEPPKPARPDFLELLYGILFTPRKTIRQVADNPPFGQALAVFFVVNILSTVLTAMNLDSQLSSRIFSAAPTAFVLTGLVVGFIDWFVVTGIFHLLAELFGGRGRGIALFSLMALANLPRLVNVPLALLSQTSASGLASLISLAVFIWVAILYVIAISEVHHINIGQSVGVLLIPLGAAIVALITMAIAFAGLAAKLLPLFENGVPPLPGL